MPPDCHDMAVWAELLDQMEAWPEDPELVDETDILGLCANGAEGGTNMPASSSGMLEAMLVGCVGDHCVALCSGMLF